MRLPEIPSKLTVVVDSREKIPILFPATLGWRSDRTGTTHEIIVNTKRDALFAGDYCLEFPDDVRRDRVCTIERKGRVSEIYTNLFTKDWERCNRAFLRLRNIGLGTFHGSAMYLLIEPSHSNFRNYERDHSLPEGIILDRLIQVACRCDLRLLFTPLALLPAARVRLGERLIRLMLGHIFHPTRDLGEYYSNDWYEKNRHNARDWGEKKK